MGNKAGKSRQGDQMVEVQQNKAAEQTAAIHQTVLKPFVMPTEANPHRVLKTGKDGRKTMTCQLQVSGQFGISLRKYESREIWNEEGTERLSVEYFATKSGVSLPAEPEQLEKLAAAITAIAKDIRTKGSLVVPSTK